MIVSVMAALMAATQPAPPAASDAEAVSEPASAYPATEPYARCVAQVGADPARGLGEAERWRDQGGGAAARHCIAVARLAMDQPALAATELMELAALEVGDPGIGARLYLQASEAFMASNAKDEAYAALRDAYELVPDSPDLHMGAAMVYATGEQWEGVVLTTTALQRHAKLSPDAYALRAKAHFKQGHMTKAAADVAAALTLDPYLVDALLIRGDLLVAGHSIPNDPFAATTP